MAILNMYSWDNVSSPAQVPGAWGGAGYLIAATPRTGPNALEIGTSGISQSPGSFQLKHSPSSTRWVQAAVRIDNFGWNPAFPRQSSYENNCVFGFFEGNGYTIPHILVGFDPITRQISVLRGFNATPIAQSVQGNLIADSTYNFMTAYVVVDDSVGRVVVTLNGVTQIDFTGDTRNGGTGVIDVTDFGFATGWTFFDDVIVGDGSGTMNTTPPGDSRVEYIVPTGAGVSTQFTPSTGENWQTIDEIGGPNDGDWNTGLEPGLTDLFTMADLSGTGIVHGIQTTIRARKDDAGIKSVVPLLYKSSDTGGTARRYEATEIFLGDGFMTTTSLYETSPDSGSAWTADEVNALQMGYRVGGCQQFSLDAVVA